jgi:hypothetical protein
MKLRIFRNIVLGRPGYPVYTATFHVDADEGEQEMARQFGMLPLATVLNIDPPSILRALTANEGHRVQEHDVTKLDALCVAAANALIATTAYWQTAQAWVGEVVLPSD